MSLNAHYMVLFKNPRDVSQFANLARQMYPKTSQFAVEAYRDATREPYSYLLVDLRPEQDEELRLGTNIFPERLTTYTFQGYKKEVHSSTSSVYVAVSNRDESSSEKVSARSEGHTKNGRQSATRLY